MNEIDHTGLENVARYALSCGNDKSETILRKVISDQDQDPSLATTTIRHDGFPHLNAFLETISEACNLDLFDNKVVMSYWLGNELTEKIGMNERSKLIERYRLRFPDAVVDHMNEILPKQMYLTHLSQVALIVSAELEQQERTKWINHCMVAYGKVISIDKEKKTASVEREILRAKEDAGFEVGSRKQVVRIDPDLTPELEVGDDISVHLGYLASKLNEDQAKSLKYWTRKVAGSV